MTFYISALKFQVSQALKIPTTKEDAFPRDPSLGSLRRSNSSPSLLSGSSDTLSPRESGSDTAQFPWQDQKGDKMKHGYKSSDSEGGDKSDDNVEKDGGNKGVGSSSVEHSIVKDSRKVQFVADEKEQKLDNIAEFSENLDEHDVKTGKGAESKLDAVSSEHVVETKDNDHLADSRPPEYHSMLSRQLSPSPASSEASSTMDEVTELPDLRRLRGHTVSVVTPTTKLMKATPIAQGGSGEPTRVGVPPSFVFLQLYHSGALQAGSDMPLLVPSNEVSNVNFIV